MTIGQINFEAGRENIYSLTDEDYLNSFQGEDGMLPYPPYGNLDMGME